MSGLPPLPDGFQISTAPQSLPPLPDGFSVVPQAAMVTPVASAAPAPAPSQDVGAVGSALRGLNSVIPFSDRVIAGLNALRGSKYDEALKAQRDSTEQAAKDHPFAFGGGATIGLAPQMMLTGGAAAIPETLGGKVVAGAGAGAGLGAVQGLSDAPDLTDGGGVAAHVAGGATLGGVLGGGLPLMARGVGAAYSGIANKFGNAPEGISSGAAKHLIAALEADGIGPVQSEASRLGDQAMMADLGPAFLGKAQGAALNSDEGRSIMVNALEGRQQGLNGRLNSDVNSALGPAEDPALVTQNILAHRSDVDNANYGKIWKQDPTADISALVDELDRQIANSTGMEKKALTGLKSELMQPNPTSGEAAPIAGAAPQLPDRMTAAEYRDFMAAQSAPGAAPTRAAPSQIPQDRALLLHKVKGDLDNVIQYDAPGLGVPSGAVARQQGSLKQMRGGLNAALEAQIPDYAGANAASAALAKRADAVKLGTSLLDSGKTALTPEALAGQYAGMEPGERAALAKGLRGEIARQLDTKANDLVAGKNIIKGEGDWNRARLSTVFGDDAANSVIGAVDREGKFSRTYNDVVQNSQTAQRQAAARADRKSVV